MCFGGPQMPAAQPLPPPPPPPAPPLPKTPKPADTTVGASQKVQAQDTAQVQKRDDDAAKRRKLKMGTGALRTQQPAQGQGINVSGQMGPSGGSLNIQR